MRDRWVLVKAFATQYRKADKSGKGRILDRFVKATNTIATTRPGCCTTKDGGSR